ncbi:hypothetical protein IFM89_016642 [Coptis chinensis]|uniref:Uncharacterized protein n=1 Tax=Coptis chinensis TaxID=261450 RepID=A0A835IT50_9MAGN|nr:hypothetical protein IFM89_016642 [Coptis chinensis]
MTGNIVETPTVGEGDKGGEPAIVDTAQEAETLVEETQNVVEANIAVEVQSTPPTDEHLNAVALMPLSPALADNSLAATPNDREFGELSISPNLNAPENAVAPQTLLCGNIAMNDASNGSDSPSQRDVVEDSPITPQSSSGNLASHEAQRLLESPSWADQTEGEWQTQKKKGSKSRPGKEPTPPPTRTRTLPASTLKNTKLGKRTPPPERVVTLGVYIGYRYLLHYFDIR